jgi:hypothetical protein
VAKEADHLRQQGHADWTLTRRVLALVPVAADWQEEPKGAEGVLVLEAADGLTPVAHIPPNGRGVTRWLCVGCDARCQMP